MNKTFPWYAAYGFQVSEPFYMKPLDRLHPLRDDWVETQLPFSHLVTSFVSGDPNGNRISVKYFKSQEPGVLWGRVWFGKGAEGPPGHAHGGAQAAALDEICGGAVWVFGHQVVAVNLQTDFVTFVPLEKPLVLRGAITKHEGRKIHTEGTIEDENGMVLARGRVLFLELKDEHKGQLIPSLQAQKGKP